MKVHFEDRPGYLVAHFSGEYSLAGMLRAIDRIAAESAARKASRVLIDVSITGDAPLYERLKYAEHAANVLHDLERCAAYAGPSQRVEEFTENAAQNRGLKLRVFREAEDAIRWLEERDS